MQRAAVTLLAATLLCADAAAQEYRPPSKDTLWVTNAVFARVNPLGLINTTRFGYRRRLEISDTAFGRDTYAFLGGSLVASPAFGRMGVHAEVEPVGLLRFAATYELVGYFGTFDQVASFPSVQGTVYSDTQLGVIGDRGDNRYRFGHVLTLSGQFKFKLGPFALRNTATAVRYDLDLPDGDVAFYDQVHDRLAPDGGFLVVNDLDVMGTFEHLRIGARYTYSASFFPKSAWDGEGETPDGALPHHRLGPLFAWQFRDSKDRARFERPTLFLLAQWWLRHPYRTGEDVSQAFPLVALGFAFESDVLWKGRRGGWKPKDQRGRPTLP